MQVHITSGVYIDDRCRYHIDVPQLTEAKAVTFSQAPDLRTFVRFALRELHDALDGALIIAHMKGRKSMENHIPLSPIESRSNITAIGYADGTLAVQFANGKIYHYGGVSPEIYDAFSTATSKGGFFAASIRPHATEGGKYALIRTIAPAPAQADEV